MNDVHSLRFGHSCPRFVSALWALACINLLGTWASAHDSQQASAQNKNTKYVCPPCGCESCGTEYSEPRVCSDCGMKLIEKRKIRNVAIAIWDGVELLDFAGPGEVFAATRSTDGQAFQVFTVSLKKEPIVSQGFLNVTPTYALKDCPKVDILVLPGGGVRKVADNQNFMTALKKRIDESAITLSVCTGAGILGRHGLLDDLDVTTWHGAIDSMQTSFPNARFHKDRRFVDNGKIITSAGVSAGIDSSLHVVSRLLGHDAAVQTARYMEYHWRFAHDSSNQ